jgi:hypothetical protein
MAEDEKDKQSERGRGRGGGCGTCGGMEPLTRIVTGKPRPGDSVLECGGCGALTPFYVHEETLRELRAEAAALGPTVVGRCSRCGVEGPMHIEGPSLFEDRATAICTPCGHWHTLSG